MQQKIRFGLREAVRIDDVFFRRRLAIGVYGLQDTPVFLRTPFFQTHLIKLALDAATVGGGLAWLGHLDTVRVRLGGYSTI